MSQPTSEIDVFYDDLGANDLQPLWTQAERLMPLTPRPRAIPWLWKWDALFELAERAGELITIDRGGDRRVLSLSNPGLDGAPFASATLWAAVQYLGPRESAPGHRHTPGAIRFVLDGEGVSTTVDGDACDMRSGDLILTPSWRWHDHNNPGDTPMVWFDGLDLPTVIALDAVFFEPYVVEDLQPVVGHNISERLFGGRATLPGRRNLPGGDDSPLLVYRWADTDATLSALLEHSDNGVAELEFTNPVNGGSVLSTLACEMLRLLPGAATAPFRKVGSSVFVVYRGAGHSIIDGQRFDWEKGDMFVVPSWSLVEHEAAELTDLFSISDAPVLRKLGLYRDARGEDPQEIDRIFQPRRIQP